MITLRGMMLLSKYSDSDLVGELRKRLALYKKIGEYDFYYSEDQDLLAVKMADDSHQKAKKGDYWVLNGGYCISPTTIKNEYIIDNSNIAEKIIWEVIKGKNIKKVLGPMYFGYVNEGFLESLQPG